MACLPITDSVSVGVPYYSIGGGGGGGGAANLICSTLTTNSGDGTFAGVADINPQSLEFGIGSSKVNQINNWGNLAGDVAYTIAATTTSQIDFTFHISTVNTVVPPISEKGTFLTIYSDSGNPQPIGGILSMGAQPDGTAYIAATTQGTPTVSTLFLVANQVKIFPEGDLVVSSINGAAPGGAIPEDLTLNSLSTVNLNVSNKANMDTLSVSSIALQGVWPVPLFQNGRFTMPNAASNVVETDVVFSDTTWFATAVYDGAVQSAVSSIGTEVLSRSTFALYAQGGLGVSWMVLGN